MAFKVNMEAALRSLARTRNRIFELIEWNKLFEQEKNPRLPRGFDSQTSALKAVREDLRSVYGLFLSLSSDIRHALERSDLVSTGEQHSKWRQRLDRLDNEVLQLGIDEKYLRR